MGNTVYIMAKHQTLINILGVSDLIAKLKNGTQQSNSLFCLYNELF
jgi:ABC-type arginine transport system permease subunit